MGKDHDIKIVVDTIKLRMYDGFIFIVVGV